MRRLAERFWPATAPEAASSIPPPYRVYTRDFDKIVDATELDSVLEPLSQVERRGLYDAWQEFETSALGWKTGLGLNALEATDRIRVACAPETLSDTVVSLLLDQSGSMRGQRILLAAAAVDVAQELLERVVGAVEILGFTTTSWHGGNSRRRWKRAGRPTLPGRLCDLLHVIYREAGSTTSGAATLRQMLRPNLLKENVDGEAIEWASERLATQPQNRKILVVISDGAPVDDSTLLENDSNILLRHLHEVIARLESDHKITVAAVGIGFDVNRFYKISTKIDSPRDLGSALLSMLERLIVQAGQEMPRA